MNLVLIRLRRLPVKSEAAYGLGADATVGPRRKLTFARVEPKPADKDRRAPYQRVFDYHRRFLEVDRLLRKSQG